MPLLTLHSVGEMLLISVSMANLRLLWLSLILTCSHLVPKKKKIDNYLTKRSKSRSINSPTPAFRFVYILMHGREECVLVSLGSRHKPKERPARPVFPDCLFVSYDYGSSSLFKQDQKEGKSKAKKVIVQGNLNYSFVFNFEVFRIFLQG